MGAQFRTARERLQMSQWDLAVAAGVSKGFLSRLENDRANPSWATLRQVAQALECVPVLRLVADADSVARTAADIARLPPIERLYDQPINVFGALEAFDDAGKAGLEHAVTGDVAGLLQGLPTPLRSLEVLVLDDDATLLVYEALLMHFALLFREVGPDGLRQWPERTWALSDSGVTVRLVDALPLTTTVQLNRLDVRCVALTELLEETTLPGLSCG